MATFQERINDLTGTDISDNAALTEWLKDGVREIMNALPAEELIKMSSILTAGGPTGIQLSSYKEVLSVTRKDSGGTIRPCRQVPTNYRGLAGDSSSLFHAGGQQDPVYYSDGGVLTIKPDPESDQQGYFTVVGYPTIAYDSSTIAATASTKTVSGTSGSAGTNYVFTTTTDHGFAIGDTIELSALDELTALNGVVSTVATVPIATTFTLDGIISTGTQETTGGTASVVGTQFPDNLDYLVVLYASIKVLQNKLASKETGNISLPSIYVSPTFTAPTLATINSMSLPSLPVAPSMSEKSVSVTGTAPTFIPPVLTVTSKPTIADLTLSVSPPVAPSLSDASINISSLTAPTYISPVMGDLNFNGTLGTNEWIVEEEDSEMLGARVQEIQTKVGEYSARVQDSLNVFNKDNAIYTQEVQAIIKESELLSADDSQKIQQYQMEVGLYQQNIQKDITLYTTNMQKDTQLWSQEVQSEIQKYSADIQNAAKKFEEESVEYQALLQKDLQNAQLAESKEGRDLQKYATEMQAYAAEVQKEIQRWTGEEMNKKFQEWTTEYQSLIATYQADIQNKSAEFQSALQKYQAEVQSMGVDYQWLHGQYQALKQDYMQGLQLVVGNKNTPPPQQQQGA